MLQWDMKDAINIIEQQPEQGQRVLVEMLDGKVRITSYDRYDFSHWAIKEWKPVPQHDAQR